MAASLAIVHRRLPQPGKVPVLNWIVRPQPAARQQPFIADLPRFEDSGHNTATSDVVQTGLMQALRRPFDGHSNAMQSRGTSVTNLYQIQNVKISDLQPAKPATCEPICERVDPRSLYVDRSYQRNVGERGTKQIREIIERFCWTKYKPPICAYADHDGQTILKVLDGQHTAIAAASNPFVDQIPVMIVDAAETAAQAEAFVGLNTRRLAVTPLQIHQAAVTAGDPEALTVELVCTRAGIKLLRTTPGSGKYNARETIAVASIRALVDKHSAMGARQILEVLANADLAPITTHHIRAAEILMTHEEYKNRFEPEDLSSAIAALFLVAEGDAKMLAHTHRQPFTEALASVWFRRTKKKRRPFQLGG